LGLASLAKYCRHFKVQNRFRYLRYFFFRFSYLIFLCDFFYTTGEYLIDKIRDAAGQKGTGKWALIEALEAGIPVNVISESVAARCLSALKEERVKASTVLVGPEQKLLSSKDCEILVEDIRNVLFIIFYL
jgi:6-phosphogluconate dehydrogenase